jgi:hypothetical protein
VTLRVRRSTSWREADVGHRVLGRARACVCVCARILCTAPRTSFTRDLVSGVPLGPNDEAPPHAPQAFSDDVVDLIDGLREGA